MRWTNIFSILDSFLLKSAFEKVSLMEIKRLNKFTVAGARRVESEIKSAMVFGERNSGTNFVDALLRQNIPALANMPNDRITERGFPYGWKHGFPQMISAPKSTLAIAVFRHPEAWLGSTHKRPWHAIASLRNLSISEFIRAEWISVVNEKNFGVEPGDTRWLTEMQWERHPLTGERFSNICELRKAKNQGFLSLRKRFANYVFVRYEDVAEDPEKFIYFVSAGFKLGRKRKFVPVEHSRGRPTEGTFVPKTYDPLTDADIEFIWNTLDADQENAMGYYPGETRMPEDADAAA